MFSPDGTFVLDGFSDELKKFLEERWEHIENKCLIAPGSFGEVKNFFRIELEAFFEQVQKIDSPENSEGLSIPKTFNTVGATSFKA